MTVEELEAEIRKLPEGEQRELLARMSPGVGPMDPTIREAWLRETERRVQAIKDGKALLHDGDSVITEARARLNAKLQNR